MTDMEVRGIGTAGRPPSRWQRIYSLWILARLWRNAVKQCDQPEFSRFIDTLYDQWKEIGEPFVRMTPAQMRAEVLALIQELY